ncbi:GapA-binding peptide SR1P [Chengkuizengella marina]|uniref:GapA-binding peptide SR1P n=1 Tax=Chengkuizengella marina TaxID=2507566 RepID=A0A6N9Q529_9BACL|nr:GapA-binding peptide SR1P [Chengkuizengella marina]NBI29922.1 GapA-binding peptide SR1P [Chengkuizengella marina]
MGQNGHMNDLGTILCKHCGEVIDTVDTDNVVTFYSSCKNDHCNELNSEVLFNDSEG